MSISHEILGARIGRLVDQKNRAYGGNSIPQIADILNLMFPDGIDDAHMLDATSMVRIFDKLFRIAREDKAAFGENPWQDIAGYALRMMQIEEENNAADCTYKSTETAPIEQDTVRELRSRIDSLQGDEVKHPAERNPPTPPCTTGLYNPLRTPKVASGHGSRYRKSPRRSKGKR